MLFKLEFLLAQRCTKDIDEVLVLNKDCQKWINLSIVSFEEYKIKGDSHSKLDGRRCILIMIVPFIWALFYLLQRLPDSMCIMI
ncbi:hypothetical protein RO3G_06943 [Rhizopus delemar RA 99-880]|uniref:Uncharacterized protein n=1 Tax=Rhizopus delemar (strain RA 99-880 / ATCC MYA-4621 / FGSC 9543 / NRRL 43880) TaxID=246409 RepID=I1C1A8_RHIO9|nr:hypothetical protein RO3G_06943 [Rhizopus delemar RA 99-880]|eukprot:EIE82238.1 hypothetical protein RO3G_06943 [Rhizopus delemar RA 99-880]